MSAYSFLTEFIRVRGELNSGHRRFSFHTGLAFYRLQRKEKKELPSLTALYLRSGNQGLVLPYDVHLLGKPERSAVMMKSLALEVQGKDLTNHLENQPSVEPMAGEKEKNLPRSSSPCKSTN
ncbi:hypothetical protein Q3G72_019563 [Acer saccharum]|nr:hypothetical protein Q3G72_007882 [Acer saccharum]KAK1548058.1 hypothetical protein Q3G72_019563 [Acer saccharum]